MVLYCAGLGAVDQPVTVTLPAPDRPLSNTINQASAVTMAVGKRIRWRTKQRAASTLSRNPLAQTLGCAAGSPEACAMVKAVSSDSLV
jgi:hypothetical protein